MIKNSNNKIRGEITKNKNENEEKRSSKLYMGSFANLEIKLGACNGFIQ